MVHGPSGALCIVFSHIKTIYSWQFLKKNYNNHNNTNKKPATLTPLAQALTPSTTSGNDTSDIELVHTPSLLAIRPLFWLSQTHGVRSLPRMMPGSHIKHFLHSLSYRLKLRGFYLNWLFPELQGESGKSFSPISEGGETFPVPHFADLDLWEGYSTAWIHF